MIKELRCDTELTNDLDRTENGLEISRPRGPQSTKLTFVHVRDLPVLLNINTDLRDLVYIVSFTFGYKLAVGYN